MASGITHTEIVCLFRDYHIVPSDSHIHDIGRMTIYSTLLD